MLLLSKKRLSFFFHFSLNVTGFRCIFLPLFFFFYAFLSNFYDILEHFCCFFSSLTPFVACFDIILSVITNSQLKFTSNYQKNEQLNIIYNKTVHTLLIFSNTSQVSSNASYKTCIFEANLPYFTLISCSILKNDTYRDRFYWRYHPNISILQILTNVLNRLAFFQYL